MPYTCKMEGVQQKSTLPNNGQDNLQTQGQTDKKMANKSSAIEEPADFSKEKTPTRETLLKQGLRKITKEEEWYQTCGRCRQLCGRICVACDDPSAGTSKAKPRRCGVCREIGHTRRSCFKAI